MEDSILKEQHPLYDVFLREDEKYIDESDIEAQKSDNLYKEIEND